MQIETLREFIAVARYHNFSEAAKSLYISQPALSNHIAALESELGTKLIQRGRDTRLTAAGKSFFTDACDIVRRCEEAIARCKAVAADEERGSLVIKSPLNTSTIEAPFLELVAEFRELHPGIDVRFIESTGRQLTDELQRGSVDCGVFYGCHDEFDFIEFIPYITTPLLAFVRTNHPLVAKERVAFEDLKDYPYPIPAGADYYEFELAFKEHFKSRGFMPEFVFKAVDSFEDYLFSVKERDAFILGAPSSGRGATLSGWTYLEFDPPCEQTGYVGLRRDGDRAVELFREFLKARQV